MTAFHSLDIHLAKDEEEASLLQTACKFTEAADLKTLKKITWHVSLGWVPLRVSCIINEIIQYQSSLNLSQEQSISNDPNNVSACLNPGINSKYLQKERVCDKETELKAYEKASIQKPYFYKTCV